MNSYHVVCGTELLDLDVIKASIAFVPGGIDPIGICVGDSCSIKVPKNRLLERDPFFGTGLIVNYGLRSSFNSVSCGSKQDLVRAQPAMVSFVSHVLHLPVNISLPLNGYRETVSSWFDLCVRVNDDSVDDGKGLNMREHGAEVILCDWTRRFVGANPVNVKRELTLVCALPSDSRRNMAGFFRDSMLRQLSASVLTSSVFEVSPFDGLSFLCVADPSAVRKVTNWSLLLPVKGENVQNKNRVPPFLIAVVLCAVISLIFGYILS